MNYPLFETIAIENGQVQRLALHQQRVDKSLRQFYSHLAPEALHLPQLAELIQVSEALSATNNAALIRCRISYNNQQSVVEYFPYERKTYRTFKPIICDDIDYSLKFTHRARLNELFSQREDCDEIIIIKQGMVTDCSIGNLIFRRGDKWFTPDKPLFAGTQRRHLIEQGKIQPCPIALSDLATFEEIRVINALNGL